MGKIGYIQFTNADIIDNILYYYIGILMIAIYAGVNCYQDIKKLSVIIFFWYIDLAI